MSLRAQRRVYGGTHNGQSLARAGRSRLFGQSMAITMDFPLSDGYGQSLAIAPAFPLSDEVVTRHSEPYPYVTQSAALRHSERSEESLEVRQGFKLTT